MNKETKELLEIAWQECIEKDKSTEYTIQYLQDFAHVSFDAAIKFYNKKVS